MKKCIVLHLGCMKMDEETQSRCCLESAKVNLENDSYPLELIETKKIRTRLMASGRSTNGYNLF